MLRIEDKIDYHLTVARLRLPKKMDEKMTIIIVTRILQDNIMSDYRYMDWWMIAAYAEKFADHALLPEGIYHSKSAIWFAVANVINDVHNPYWWGQLYAAAIAFAQEGD